MLQFLLSLLPPSFSASLSFLPPFLPISLLSLPLQVSRHVSDAVSKGADVVVGGRCDPVLGGTFYQPSVLTGIQSNMLISQAGNIWTSRADNEESIFVTLGCFSTSLSASCLALHVSSKCCINSWAWPWIQLCQHVARWRCRLWYNVDRLFTRSLCTPKAVLQYGSNL